MNAFVRRGEVVLLSLDPTVGTEMRKTRPCVVVSNDIANEASPQVTVVPVTGFDGRKARLPICVEAAAGEGGLRHRSIVVCSHLRTVDKRRLVGRPLGRLSSQSLARIGQAIKIHLALP